MKIIKHSCLFISFAMVLPLANADVGSALTSYFNSMQGNSKIERPTVTTNGFTGGGYYQRGANVDMTLGYITPPSLKGGCGNIDFNMGAFSFISGDQIVAALQSIGQNAKGMLFMEAIGLVSPDLAGNIKAFFDQANKWLGILKNSCQAASMLVGGINNSMGLCQNAARFNNSLSDENVVQSTCQSYDQGIKEFNDLTGSNLSTSQQEAKAALANQLTMQGGILHNLLADYFASTGRTNDMQKDLGNLIISTIGDTFIMPTDKNNNNNKGQATPIAIKPTATVNDLLSYTVHNAATQRTKTNKKIYNCDFTYDKDNHRAKTICFNMATDSYSEAGAGSLGEIPNSVYTQINAIHNKLISNSSVGITDSDLTLLSLSEAPVFQVMQAGIDVGVDAFTMPIVEKWMDYAIHKIYFRLYSDINASIKVRIAALQSTATEQQIGTLMTLSGSLQNAQDQIAKQLEEEVKKNELDFNGLLTTLKNIRQQIIQQVSPDIQQELSFTSTVLKAN